VKRQALVSGKTGAKKQFLFNHRWLFNGKKRVKEGDEKHCRLAAEQWAAFAFNYSFRIRSQLFEISGHLAYAEHNTRFYE
jgi:hypothetical protein